MAAPSPMRSLQEEAVCAICLDYFQDPVSIGCGHNFCLGCVTQLWGRDDEEPPRDAAAAARALRDNERFIREVLYRRHAPRDWPRLREREERRRRLEPRAAAWQDADDELGALRGGAVPDLRVRVLAEDDRGPDRRRPVRRRLYPPSPPASPPRALPRQQPFTCPQCRKSFPHRSLRPNLELANLVNIIRQMCPSPSKSSELSVCPKHHEILKFYCEVDEKAICVVCRESKRHKHHSVVPLEEVLEESCNPSAPETPRKNSGVPE